MDPFSLEASSLQIRESILIHNQLSITEALTTRSGAGFFDITEWIKVGDSVINQFRRVL